MCPSVLHFIIFLHCKHCITLRRTNAGYFLAVTLYACIAAGVACLWGPAHGGANEAALKMLMEIGTVENIPKVIARAKDKNDPFRLMGFGHRVYKNYDPRA